MARPWKESSIYFILIDRFANGDRANDDQGAGEFNPHDNDCFQGGDLKGISNRLPYIKRLGFDTIWITPPVYNQWINPDCPTRGYHGYWAWDFTQVDPHFGTVDDYRALVNKAHKLGLRVIQDIVINHTGNFFTVDPKKYDPMDVTKAWSYVSGAFPPGDAAPAPRDPLFAMNNPNMKAHREAAVYNFTPSINDYNNRDQTLNWTLADLDDLNLNNIKVVERFAEIYNYWIKEVGVDGFRIDTVFYTPESCYEKLLFSQKSKEGFDGIKTFARKLGKKDFFVVGEVWAFDYSKINAYIRSGKIRRLDGSIDIALNEKLGQVFFEKNATAILKPFLEQKRENPHHWMNFLDSHDSERIFARSDWPSIAQSLVALFTLPGIPCINYGTEIGLEASRQNMFDDQRLKTPTPCAKLLRTLIRFRKAYPMLSESKVRVIKTSLHRGVLAYEVYAAKKRMLVVFNTSDDHRLFIIPPELQCKKILLNKNGQLNTKKSVLTLGPNAYVAIAIGTKRALKEKSGLKLLSFKTSDKPNSAIAKMKLPPLKQKSELCLIFDQCLDLGERCGTSSLKNMGHDLFECEISTKRLDADAFEVQLMLRDKERVVVSSPLIERIEKQYTKIGEIRLSEKHHSGVFGNILAPTHSSYVGQMTIESVTSYTCSDDLRLEFKMASVTNAWNPTNGFDHVYFSVFFSVPGQASATELPKLGHRFDGFSFSHASLLYGWGSNHYFAAGSAPNRFGRPNPVNVRYHVDLAKKTITFTFPRAYFGKNQSLSGLRVLVTTWDGYMGNFHEINPEPSEWRFSVQNKKNSDVPKIHDYVLFPLEFGV